MLVQILDSLIETATVYFFFFASIYQTFTDDRFFNIRCTNETFIEEVADFLLIPYQYAFMGRIASPRDDGSWHFESRFNYNDYFWIKNIPSFLFAQPSLLLGGAIKGLACLDQNVRIRYQTIQNSQIIHLHNDEYQNLGLFQENPISEEIFISLGHPRRPGDENHLSEEKEALREIGKALTNAGIFWWVDCGTCLGTYRYGGVIPWDFDIDIALLEPDFENVEIALKQLDPKKYILMDVSAREHPMSLMRVILKNHPLKQIDLYYFRIIPQSRMLQFILSQENHIFMLESWKIREKPFKTPTKFENIFPLKKAIFDGIEVFVPNNITQYLSRVYGENLAPAKKYSAETGEYEKDLSHPYWQRPFAH